MSDVQHDVQWSRMSFDMDYLLGAFPTDSVILRFIDDVRWLRAQLVESEATLATIGGADKATLARKLRRANAEIERLRGDLTRITEQWEADSIMLHRAAPATRPDERAAKERAVAEALSRWTESFGIIQYAQLRGLPVEPKFQNDFLQASIALHDAFVSTKEDATP